MKRHFLAGFMAFCVGVMSLTTVSCTKEIEQDIADLKEQVADIQKKLAELQEKLTNDVKTLNELIAAAKTAAETADAKLKADLEAQIAVIGFKENADGTVTLTFGNGKSVVVSAPVELDPNANNTGLVSTVEVDGKLYWATVNADGTKTSLGVEVGHPTDTIDFQVDADTKELLVSINNGQFEGTGVFIKDPDTYDHTIVTAVENDDNTVTITIGEASYVLPMYEEMGAVLLDRTEMFVLPGGSKTVNLTAEGVSEYYVMSKPDGWKTSLVDDVLTVTAPSQAVYDFGACETEGQVLVHATSATGKCVVAALNVKTGDAIKLEFANGNVRLFNALVIETVHPLYGPQKDFATVTVGIIPASEFLGYESERAFFEAAYANEMGSGFANVAGNYDYNIITWYEEGVNEEFDATLPLEALADGMWPKVELDENETYVIWILPSTQDEVLYDMAQKAYTKPYINVKASNEVYNDVDLAFNLDGADSYYIGTASQNDFYNMGVTTLEEYLMMGGWQPGKWEQFTGGNNSAIGTQYLTGNHEVKLSELVGSNGVEANAEYHVWVLPYYNDKANSEYDIQADLLANVTVCKTAARTLNENLVASITDIVSTPFSVSATLTPPEGAETYYYTFDEDWYNSLTSEDIMMYLKYGYPVTEAIDISETYNVQPNSTTYLVTYSVKGGEEGKVDVTKLKAGDITYSPDLKVTFVSLTEDEAGANYIATFNIEGTSSFAGYNISYPGSSYSPSVPKFVEYIYKQSFYTITSETADENGNVTVTFPKNARKTHYLASCYTLADDAVSALATVVVIDLATGTVVDTTADE